MSPALQFHDRIMGFVRHFVFHLFRLLRKLLGRKRPSFRERLPIGAQLEYDKIIRLISPNSLEETTVDSSTMESSSKAETEKSENEHQTNVPNKKETKRRKRKPADKTYRKKRTKR